MAVNIAYFVHDLSDAAVHRRVRMLTLGGATVVPIGFRRGSSPVSEVEGNPAIDLGRTADGMLARRTLSVLGVLARLERIAGHVGGANVVIARNLEMLVVAIRARRLYAPEATVIYECLDIHRMLLSNDLTGRLLRLLETRLWNEVDLLLTSSPAFVRNHFVPRGFPAPTRIVENKGLSFNAQDSQVPKRHPPSGPPWRIGWFGIIRCRKSLEILSALAKSADGAVEVIIRGRPSDAIFPNFVTVIDNLPYIRFAGPYRNPVDLPDIYGEVHFSWTIDYYEAGKNSAWLLPNRMYEGSLYGAVPIALEGVETGRWLTVRKVGVVVGDPPEAQLVEFFRGIDRDCYDDLAKAIADVPRADLITGPAECRDLVAALCNANVRMPGALSKEACG